MSRSRAASTDSIRMLYVDDAYVDRMAFEQGLQRSDYDCHVAASVNEALACMDQQAFDVIVSDYDLGDGTAFEILERAAGIPVILVTGVGDEEIAVQAINRGACDYLVKDASLAYLRMLPLTVENALAHQRAQQALRESEERFRIMADTAPVMIWMADPDLSYSYFNAPWLAFTGRSHDQECAAGWLDGIHPDDRACVVATSSEAMRAREPFRLEFRLQRFDGDYGWVLNTGTPRLAIEHGFMGYIGSCIDISERKAMELSQKDLLVQVERSHENLISILNGLSVGVLLSDASGRIHFVNQACVHLLHKNRDEIIGQTWRDALPISRESEQLIEETMSQPGAERRRQSVTMIDPNGRQYWVDVEVQDDPRDRSKKMLFLHDMTAVHDLRSQLNDKATVYGIVGKCEAMQGVYQHIDMLGKLDTTVLVEGETGTGKELVARAIHDGGSRQKKPFIALNCAGLTESLLASQLFGHRRGAFTGAVQDHAGVFESANGGTLFLDEIGDISTAVQTSLLRVLQ